LGILRLRGLCVEELGTLNGLKPNMMVPYCIFGANKKAELSMATTFDPPPYSLENTSFGEVVLHYSDPFPFVQRSNPKKNIVYEALCRS